MVEDFIDLYGIFFECPARTRSIDCPIIKMEKLSFKSKMMWFYKLTDEEKSKLQKHHIECSNKRDKKV